MTVPPRSVLAAVVGLWMAHPLPAQEPPRLAAEPGQALPPPPTVSANQQMANTIAERLKQGGQLRDYRIDITYRHGTAELSGMVADQPQREEALRLVQGVPGVEKVIDRLTLPPTPGLVQAQDRRPALEEPNRLVPRPAEPVPPPVPPVPPVPQTGGPVGRIDEPLPLGPYAPTSPYDVNPPKMPPYAWPTYAPYNNYSRVAYPLAYPYQSWPFIGPPYPFPKIPLGWRSVKLEWLDGYWWFSKTATKHDWWRLRYW